MENTKQIQQTEPTILGRVSELLNYVSTLEHHCADIESGVMGSGSASDAPKGDMPSSLEGLLANATTRTANLCGWLATIKNRIGCHEYERGPSPKNAVPVADYTRIR